MTPDELKGQITITKKEYYRLRCAEAKLDLLEQGGVDNWEWYGESLHPDGDLSIWDIEEDIKKEVLSA